MNKNYPGIARNKFSSFRNKVRVYYFRSLGSKIGKNVILGKIICDWPNKLKIGAGSTIENNVALKITKPFDDGNLIEIGSDVFIGHGCQFNCGEKIIIGNDCLIAGNTVITDTGHEILAGIPINKQAVLTAPVILENDVWIGAGCTILKGVTIGTSSVIGAGSVVNKSIPSNEIWAGVPARFIRKRL